MHVMYAIMCINIFLNVFCHKFGVHIRAHHAMSSSNLDIVLRVATFCRAGKRKMLQSLLLGLPLVLFFQKDQ